MKRTLFVLSLSCFIGLSSFAPSRYLEPSVKHKPKNYSNNISFDLGTYYRGAMIEFYHIDNVVKIYKRFRNGREQLVYSTPHVDNDPNLDPNLFQHRLIHPDDTQGVYTFRIEVLNEGDKGHHNPWHVTGVISEIGENNTRKSEINPRTFDVKSSSGNEHNTVKTVQTITINKRF